MSDHHQRGDSPLYGTGPGTPYPPLAGDPSSEAPQRDAVVRLPELLEQLGGQLFTAARTVGAIADLLCETRDQGAEPAAAPSTEDGQDDLTGNDHLATNTVKDDAYGMDSGLQTPAQTWTWAL